MSKKMIYYSLFTSLLFVSVGYFFSNSYDYGLCYSSVANNTFDVSCHELFESIGNPFYYSMPALAFVFLLLLIAPRAVPAWKKFAKWYIPGAVLLFIFYDGPGGFDLFSPYPEDVYKWASVLYVFISAGIITWSLWGSKK